MNFQILIRRERSLQIHLYQEKHCLWCYRKVPSLGNMKKRSLTQASWISVEDAENKNGMEKWTVKAHLVGDRSCTVSTKMISGAGLQFSSVQSLSHVQLFVTPWIAALQASLSINNSWSSLRFTSIESVMPSSDLILCRPLLLLPPIPPSISLFQWVNSSHEVAKGLEFQLQHQSFQRHPRADLLQNRLVGSPCSPRDSQEPLKWI